MTCRQRILKMFYPLLMRTNMNKKIRTSHVEPQVSIHSLEMELNDGSCLKMGKISQKKILIVNTAGDCGYTAQYRELQSLFEQYSDRLMIIAFPSNDFKEQESGSDHAIGEFCRIHFGVSFPVVKKSTVIKSKQQHPVFRWLCNKNQNGWNDGNPDWNFTKYLIDESGNLKGVFGPGVSPMDLKSYLN